MKNSPYNLIHAIAAAVVVVFTFAFNGGFAAFWHRFIHGQPQSFTPDLLLKTLMLQTGFYSVLLLIIWASTFIPRLLVGSRVPRDRTPNDSSPTGTTGVPPVDTTSTLNPQHLSLDSVRHFSRLGAIVFALKLSLPIILVAIGLNALGSKTIEWLAGVHPAEQEMVKCFIDPTFPIGTRVFMVLSVAIQAPLFEELLFRGIIFRGFAKKLPLVAAMLLQGCIFSLVHVNAASFAAIWFLGVAFAWLYARTRTILAPMTLHAAFNIANVLLLFFFPELAS